jgi:hypothetical protein
MITSNNQQEKRIVIQHYANSIFGWQEICVCSNSNEALKKLNELKELHPTKSYQAIKCN